MIALLAACPFKPAEPVRQQVERLRASWEAHLPAYAASIEAENRLIPETIAWLKGSAVTAPRGQAAAEARRLMDRWARVYFVPRHMHEQLRFDAYSSARVTAVQKRLLAGLQRRYFELHEYQRYAQHAAESEMYNTRAGRLPRELEEFRTRLEARRPAVDEIRPLLEELRAESFSSGLEVEGPRWK